MQVAPRPFGVTLSPDGRRAYVASALCGEITVVDVGDLDVTETWGPFGEYLYAVIPSNSGDGLFAYGLGGANLVAIDAGTGRLHSKIPIGPHISDALPGPGNTLLVGSTANKEVVIVGQESLEIEGRISFDHPIGYIAVGQNEKIACATGGVYAHHKGQSSARGGPVSFFDPTQSGRATVAEALRVGSHTRKPVFVQNDRFLLVPDRLEGTVRVFDVQKKSLIKIVDVGAGPEKIIAHPTRDEAYTIDTLGRSVTVLSLSPFDRVRHIRLPANPEDGVLSPDGRYLYLTLSAASLVNNRIAVIDLKEREAVDLIPTGKDPCRMAITPDGRTLFVTNFIENTLSVIR